MDAIDDDEDRADGALNNRIETTQAEESYHGKNNASVRPGKSHVSRSRELISARSHDTV